MVVLFFSRKRRHTRVALVTGFRRVLFRSGAFMDPETRTLIRERATSVWLRADAELLLRRTSRRNNRPLLKRGDPHEILNRLIEERHPVYAQDRTRVV